MERLLLKDGGKDGSQQASPCLSCRSNVHPRRKGDGNKKRESYFFFLTSATFTVTHVQSMILG